jgi:DNA-binding NarL/FixJ family response regulator
MAVPLVTNVLLADDHPVFRRGLRQVLDREADLRVVDEVSDGAEAVDRALAGDVHLAVLDVSMPRMTGLQAAREITRRDGDVRVLVLSMHDNERYFFEALEAGASGYVLKTAADRDIVDACRAAMRGEPFLYPGAVRALVRDYLERAPRRDPEIDRGADPARAGDRQAHRGGAHQRRDSEHAVHQQEDRRAPPREHPREARDERPGRAHALRDPPRPRRALTAPAEADHTRDAELDGVPVGRSRVESPQASARRQRRERRP